ncbi:MAG TPA: nucleotidyltransferase family protein [Steroidobacteraceae bacterium]
MPPRSMIELGLSAATEHFAAELADPKDSAPDWTAFEWQMARAAAVLHGVTPLLGGTLKWIGPPSWQSFMLEQRRQTQLRYQRIAAVLEAIDARATAAGLAIVALKGAALHALRVYSAGERPMADIDLLVRPADAAHAVQMLAALGYVQTAVTWKHQVFEPRDGAGEKATMAALPVGEHQDYPVKIELHTRIMERLPLTEVEITERVFPAHPKPGLNFYPSIHALLLHLLLHATGNMSARALRLMHLHDIARLAARMSPDDWELLVDSRATPQALWWALPPLEMINRYQPGRVPARVLAALRAECPGVLRRLSRRTNLSQMSYASLSIPALPGLPWCRSLSERGRYAWRRVVPGREQAATRQIMAAEQWSAQRPWTHMSQRRRILQWLFRRPARDASMYIVRAILESPRTCG